jgi:hypothetical protein
MEQAVADDLAQKAASCRSGADEPAGEEDDRDSERAQR